MENTTRQHQRAHKSMARKSAISKTNGLRRATRSPESSAYSRPSTPIRKNVFRSNGMSITSADNKMTVYYLGSHKLANRYLRVLKKKPLRFWHMFPLTNSDFVISLRPQNFIIPLIYASYQPSNRPRILYCTDGLNIPLLETKRGDFIVDKTIYDGFIVDQPYIDYTFLDDTPLYNLTTSVDVVEQKKLKQTDILRVILPNNSHIGSSRTRLLKVVTAALDKCKSVYVSCPNFFERLLLKIFFRHLGKGSCNREDFKHLFQYRGMQRHLRVYIFLAKFQWLRGYIL